MLINFVDAYFKLRKSYDGALMTSEPELVCVDACAHVMSCLRLIARLHIFRKKNERLRVCLQSLPKNPICHGTVETTGSTKTNGLGLRKTDG